MSQKINAPPIATPGPLFQGYKASATGFDEMALPNGSLRPHWQNLVSSLEHIGRPELTARWEDACRILKEHGVTYNVYGDSQGTDRPWGLDLVPLMLSQKEWASIEAGLIQRSRLFNMVLSDLYGGAQHLLRDGFLPPELVYANPGFLRPCRGIRVPREVYLHLHACDLARSNEGKWWVLADRTQAPSGAGYALENRSVISRVLPNQIRETGVQRLPEFFRQHREMLFRLAPEGCESPNVVLLTAGPHNETYFEHAYLARNLGFSLVEGADLTVRDRRVFLKTLDGLQQVDVILRRMDDSFCDPLELRTDSFLGVAGLVEATRAGKVTLANALGTGLLEAPAFLAFMGSLCRHLLGEELLLPSVATWWCGQAEELRYVLEHLEQLVIKPAFTPFPRQPWFGGALSTSERRKLADMIRAAPEDFIGQERASLSRAPVWMEGQFESRSVVLRTYVANGGQGFAVMPGGLTRVSRTQEDPLVSMQSGGGSKDTWVLTGDPKSQTGTVHIALEPKVVERAASGVASRAADNLFWLGRYTERLEERLRILRCLIGRLSDETTVKGSPALQALAGMLLHMDFLPAPLSPTSTAAELQRATIQLVYKGDASSSVPRLVGCIRSIASAVRDRFSGDTWRILGRLDTDSRSRPGKLPLASANRLIQDLILDLAALSGMEMENMTRGQGWRFLDIGRRVERGLNLLHVLRGAVSLTGGDTLRVLEPVLEIADSVMTYRRRYFAEPRLLETIDLLVRDETNPRSLNFQLQRLLDHCGALPGASHEAQLSTEKNQIARLRLDLNLHRLEAVQNDTLLEWLDRLSTNLTAFSDHLTTRYFSHSLPRVR